MKKHAASHPISVPERATGLRRRAESRLGAAPAPLITELDAQCLVQELQIHQIELELQNEELKNAKAEVEAGLEKYTALDDFAPVGYFSLEPTGLIREVNLTGAGMLRVGRAMLVGRRFPFFIAMDGRARFDTFLTGVLAGTEKQEGDFTLQSPGRAAFRADLHAISALSADGHNRVCHLTVVDATARHQAIEARGRVDVLSAANHELVAEVARRRTAEEALRKSERHARDLLTEAAQLQEKLRLVSHRILLVQEEQRKKLSRELHDDISQLLVGIIVNLGNFTKAASADPSCIRRELPPLRRLVERSVRVVHRFARDLRPSMLDDIGLVAALESYIAEFPKVKNRRIALFADYGTGPDRLDNLCRTALFRVAQEALTNVHKHARAHEVTVRLTKTRGLITLEIKDDGRAFSVERIASPGWGDQLGLIGMRERVEMIGGRFEITSSPEAGTRVWAEVPTGRARAVGPAPVATA
jgi:signal transduction histidine kinase